MGSSAAVVYAYAKILILKQITTTGEPLGKRGGVVYAYAKILILKQITTCYWCWCWCWWLYMPMQRY